MITPDCSLERHHIKKLIVFIYCFTKKLLKLTVSSFIPNLCLHFRSFVSEKAQFSRDISFKLSLNFELLKPSINLPYSTQLIWLLKPLRTIITEWKLNFLIFGGLLNSISITLGMSMCHFSKVILSQCEHQSNSSIKHSLGSLNMVRVTLDLTLRSHCFKFFQLDSEYSS